MQYLLKIIVKYKSKPFSSSKDKSLLNIINEKTDEQFDKSRGETNRDKNKFDKDFLDYSKKHKKLTEILEKEPKKSKHI